MLEPAPNGDIRRRCRTKALALRSIPNDLEFRINPMGDAQKEIGAFFLRQPPHENDAPIETAMSQTDIGRGVALDYDPRRIIAIPTHLRARELGQRNESQMALVARIQLPIGSAHSANEERSGSRTTITSVADGRQTPISVQAILADIFVPKKCACSADETKIMQRLQGRDATDQGSLDSAGSEARKIIMEMNNVGIEGRNAVIEGSGDRGVVEDLDRSCSLVPKTNDFVVGHNEVFNVMAKLAKKQGLILHDHVFATALLIAIMSDEDAHCDKPSCSPAQTLPNCRK